MSRKASLYSMTVTRGSTWTETFRFQDDVTGAPVDLTGYSARMQVRTFAGRQGLTTSETLVMELTTANERLVIVPAEGVINIHVSAEETELLSPLNVRERYVYALELVNVAENPEVVIPFLTGKINVRPEITR